MPREIGTALLLASGEEEAAPTAGAVCGAALSGAAFRGANLGVTGVAACAVEPLSANALIAKYATQFETVLPANREVSIEKVRLNIMLFFVALLESSTPRGYKSRKNSNVIESLRKSWKGLFQILCNLEMMNFCFLLSRYLLLQVGKFYFLTARVGLRQTQSTLTRVNAGSRIVHAHAAVDLVAIG